MKYYCKNCGKEFTPASTRGASGRPSAYCDRLECIRERRNLRMREYRKFILSTRMEKNNDVRIS